MHATRLKPEELKTIQVYTSHPDEAVQRRAQILVLYSQGYSTAEIAVQVGLAVRSVRHWRQRFEESGLAIFPESEMPTTDSESQATESATEEAKEQLETLDIGSFLSRYPNAEKKAAHVQKLVYDLFDATRKLHKLNDRQGELLQAAAALHALPGGDEIDPKKAATLVRTNPFAGFSEQEHIGVENLVRYQNTNPTGKYDAGAFGGIKKQTFLRLLALLRLAIYLDSSNTQKSLIERVIVSPGELVVVVSGPKSAQDAQTAQREGRLWAKLYRQKVRVMTTAQSAVAGTVTGQLPVIKPMKQPGIQAVDPIAEAARKTLRFHFAEMLRHEQGTRLGDDIEELHDMRVATRRMRVAFDVFDDVFERKLQKRLLKQLRSVGRALGRVRDLDVFIEKGQAYLGNLPAERQSGLEPLFMAWESQRAEARDQMIKFLDGPDYQLFLLNFHEFVSTPGMGVKTDKDDQGIQYLVRHAAPILIYDRLADVRAYETILAGASIEQFHALRIEFKRLRYTLEYLREVLGEGVDEVVDEVKKVQDHLGDLNDADVACTILNDFLQRWEGEQQNLPVSDRESPEPIVAYLATKHAERHALMTSFMGTWEQFNRPEIRRSIALCLAEL
jgi:CHAD domain-containing protein/transposase